MTKIIRFVDLSTTGTKVHANLVKRKENFLGFVSLEKVTGAFLA